MITGLVTDPGSSPVAGAAVVVRLVKDVTCEEPELVTVRQARTDESGRFRHQEAWSGGRKCFLVWAEPPAGSPWSRSESTAVRIDFLDRIVPDSVEIRLRLR